MPDQLWTIVCQRCGHGFILTAIDYAQEEAHTSYGRLGVEVCVYKEGRTRFSWLRGGYEKA